MTLQTDHLTTPSGSLCPDTAEEAKTLIPSLETKISDEDLQDLLDELMKLRNFVQ